QREDGGGQNRGELLLALLQERRGGALFLGRGGVVAVLLLRPRSRRRNSVGPRRGGLHLVGLLGQGGNALGRSLETQAVGQITDHALPRFHQCTGQVLDDALQTEVQHVRVSFADSSLRRGQDSFHALPAGPRR